MDANHGRSLPTDGHIAMDVVTDSHRTLKYPKDHAYTIFAQIINGLAQDRIQNAGKSGRGRNSK